MRAKTGIQKLDEMLGGGLIARTITLVAGKPGTGKSTLATQFLLEGIRRGENGAYLSLDEEKHRFFINMCGFGWDLKKLQDDGRLYFESFRTEELQSQIADGYQNIDRELRRINAKRLVVDSITAYLLACPSELARRNELKRLFDNIRKWGVTAVLIGESIDSGTNYGVDYLVDTILRLHLGRGQNLKKQRLIEVEKMRGSWHSEELVPLRITCDGLQVGEDD
jgi:circadian clock protein KaiC